MDHPHRSARAASCRVAPYWLAMCTSLVPCLGATPSAFAASQQEPPKPPAIAWCGDFDAALAKAQAERRPLMIAFLMDDEPANDTTLREHWADPDVLALAKHMVCLVGNVTDHGSGDGPCPKFGTITCKQHQAVEKKARARYVHADVVRAPQHVFCSPLGTEILRKVWLVPKEELALAMALAVAQTIDDPLAKRILQRETAAADALLAGLDDNNLEVVEKTMRDLAQLDDPRVLPAILAKAKPANKDMVRAAAISALGVKGNHAAIAPLTTFLRDPSAKVVALSAMALERIQLPDAAPELVAALRRERRDRVRGFLLRAAARCLPESDEVRKHCLADLRGASQQLRGAVLRAVYHLQAHATITAAVLPLLRDDNQNTRALAAWVLGKQRDPKLLPHLEKLMAKDAAPEVQALAAKAVQFCRGEAVEGYDSAYSGFQSDDAF